MISNLDHDWSKPFTIQAELTDEFKEDLENAGLLVDTR